MNVTTKPTMKTKSVLSYFGSDASVAADLASLLDGCRHVTIPFIGGASILPHLKARSIVANDLHEHAINFYRVLGGRYGAAARERLIDACCHTLSHPKELNVAHEILAGMGPGSEFNRAWAFWATCWIGRKGKGGTRHQGGMPSVRRTANGGSNASRVRAAAGDLHAWAYQFTRCEWEQTCFRELLPKVADRPDCGVYCDPPWVNAGRDYLHTFAERDHRDLAELLTRFRETRVVVRYGDHPLIRELYAGWEITEAESRTQSNALVGEIWITNCHTN